MLVKDLVKLLQEQDQDLEVTNLSDDKEEVQDIISVYLCLINGVIVLD